MAGPFMIRARRKSGGQWNFITPTGGLNRLKVHACRWEDGARAPAVLDGFIKQSSEYEFQVVRFDAPAPRRTARLETTNA